MSAQARYKALVASAGAIYSAPKDTRTPLLQKGLYDIMGAVHPANSDDWGVVERDSERLLKIWLAKENDSECRSPASAFCVELMDLLSELSAASSAPSLVIAEAAKSGADTVRHVRDYHSVSEEDEDEDEDEDEEEYEPPTKVVVLTVPVVKSVATPVPVPVVPQPSSVVEEKEEVEKEEDEEVEEEEEEEEEEVEEEIEEVEEEIEEVEEEEEEEEEEEGVEVEPITIRGRSYWLDSNSKKLYANAAGDEVGDEVGSLVNGKPVFLA